jgi:hypothetical protein
MRITQSMMNWKYGSTEPLPKRREITFFRPLPIELDGKEIERLIQKLEIDKKILADQDDEEVPDFTK